MTKIAENTDHNIDPRSTGVKKTYGFVDFAEYGIVKKVVLCGKHYIHGKRIR
jgi:hypothetical protein